MFKKHYVMSTKILGELLYFTGFDRWRECCQPTKYNSLSDITDEAKHLLDNDITIDEIYINLVLENYIIDNNEEKLFNVTTEAIFTVDRRQICQI